MTKVQQALERIFVSPVPEGTRISQMYGERPEYYKLFDLLGHEGIDFEWYGKVGAIGGGVVISTPEQHAGDNNHPYGNHVRIMHTMSDGIFHSIYAHLQNVYVTPGQVVTAGHIIGFSGTSGNSTGIHLHLTLKLLGATAAGITPERNDIVNPEPYLGLEVEPPPQDPYGMVIDVSHWNKINPVLLARENISGMIVKAYEPWYDDDGVLQGKDDSFDFNWNLAQNYIIRGVYMFPRYNLRFGVEKDQPDLPNAATQARIFCDLIEEAGGLKGAFPVLDIETTIAEMYPDPNREAIWPLVVEQSIIIERRLGVKPWFYANRSTYDWFYLEKARDGNFIWEMQYMAILNNMIVNPYYKPPLLTRYGPDVVRLWQYSGWGKIAGIRMDLNVPLADITAAMEPDPLPDPIPGTPDPVNNPLPAPIVPRWFNFRERILRRKGTKIWYRPVEMKQ